MVYFFYRCRVRLVTSTPFDNLLLLVILCWFSSNFTIKLLEFKGLVGSHVVIIYTSKGLRLAFSAVSTGSTHEMLVLMLECYIGLLRSHYYFYKLVLLLLVIINWATFEFLYNILVSALQRTSLVMCCCQLLYLSLFRIPASSAW